MYDETDNAQRVEVMQGQGGAAAYDEMMATDMADGDDLVFFNKYGANQKGGLDHQDSEEIDDDSFENGYYF